MGWKVSFDSTFSRCHISKAFDDFRQLKVTTRCLEMLFKSRGYIEILDKHEV